MANVPPIELRVVLLDADQVVAMIRAAVSDEFAKSTVAIEQGGMLLMEEEPWWRWLLRRRPRVQLAESKEA
jgi:hypothetical protein